MIIFAVSEIGNLYSHIVLSSIRKRDPQAYKIPDSFLFKIVACPNYTFEFFAWLGFNLMSHSVFGVLFMLAGLLQMTQWALQKHRRCVCQCSASRSLTTPQVQEDVWQGVQGEGRNHPLPDLSSSH